MHSRAFLDGNCTRNHLVHFCSRLLCLPQNHGSWTARLGSGLQGPQHLASLSEYPASCPFILLSNFLLPGLQLALLPSELFNLPETFPLLRDPHDLCHWLHGCGNAHVCNSVHKLLCKRVIRGLSTSRILQCLQPIAGPPESGFLQLEPKSINVRMSHRQPKRGGERLKISPVRIPWVALVYETREEFVCVAQLGRHAAALRDPLQQQIPLAVELHELFLTLTQLEQQSQFSPR
mmetsp:Transcript_56560/g.150782  ORF Transcript_56560/g.150782 Transcript_56560/m.150782 type:complete len:234 (+) Transcript_56560:401-1102(+)